MVSTKAKKFIFKTAIFGMLFGAPSCHGNSDKTQDKKNDKIEVPTNSKKEKPNLSKKYKIETREDFDVLYHDAEPFIFAIMIPTENWRPDFHNDKQKKNATPNSVSVGLYYVGVNPETGALDFSSKKWKKTKTFVLNYRNTHNGKNPPNLTPPQMYQGTCGWFQDMDDGRHLRDLFKHLRGAELTIHEFAAIASVYYNDEVIGKDVCDYIKNNYKTPKKCAQYIIESVAKLNGIKPRRVHEVLVYLNYKDYCSDVYSLEVDGHLGTQVSNLNPQYNNLKKGITRARLDDASQTIYNHVVKNGHPIRYYINKLDPEQRKAVLAFAGYSAKAIQMEERGKFYELALEKYSNKDYEGALELFQKVVANNGNSADLYNDIAITYYHLGMYQECIEQSQKTLQTDEIGKYMFAKYNSGLAYWALKDYEQAITNFQEAVDYAKTFGDKDRQSVYESKLAKCKKEQSANKATTSTKKENLTKGTQKIHAMMQKGPQKISKTFGGKHYT